MKRLILAFFSLPLLLVGCANTRLGEQISSAVAPQAVPEPIEATTKLPPNLPLPIYQNSKLIATQSTDREGRLVFTVDNGRDALQFYQTFFTTKEWQNLSQSGEQIISFNRQYIATIGIRNTTLTISYTELQSPISTPPAPITPTPPPPTPNPAPPLPPSAANPYINDLAKLGIIPPGLNLNGTISRREYARWLVTANNRLFQDRPAQQIRLVSPDRELPIFKDVPQSDPDFPFIQGLANAGIIDRNSQTFHPDRPLTREVLVQWKVPLDFRKPIPPASSNAVASTWNFQDATKISPSALGAVLMDNRSGELSNIRRSFGFTTLFQPQKHVSRSEAATALWYFGDGETGISAKEVLNDRSKD